MEKVLTLTFSTQCAPTSSCIRSRLRLGVIAGTWSRLRLRNLLVAGIVTAGNAWSVCAAWSMNGASTIVRNVVFRIGKRN